MLYQLSCAHHRACLTCARDRRPESAVRFLVTE